MRVFLTWCVIHLEEHANLQTLYVQYVVFDVLCLLRLCKTARLFFFVVVLRHEHFASAMDAGCLLRLCKTPCFFLCGCLRPPHFASSLDVGTHFEKKSQIQTYVKCHNRKIWTIMFASVQECICDFIFHVISSSHYRNACLLIPPLLHALSNSLYQFIQYFSLW